MKKFLSAVFILVLILLCGCTPAGNQTTDTTSDTSAQTDETTIDDSENAFSLDFFEAENGYESYYYEVTSEELLTEINNRMVKAGYQPFILVDTYITTHNDLTDSYYYKTDGKSGQLELVPFHRNNYVSRVNMRVDDAQTPAALNQFLMETLVDIFAPGKGKEVCAELGIYDLSGVDPASWKEVTVGNTEFKISGNYEFSVENIEY